MERQELGQLLHYISVSQGRTVTEDDMTVWFDAVRDLDGDVALEATRLLVRETSDFITPARVRERCNTLAAKRLTEAPHPDLPSGLDADQYTRWLREYRRLIIKGVPTQDANTQALAAAGIDAGDHFALERSHVDLPKLGLPTAVTGTDDADDVVDAEVIGD